MLGEFTVVAFDISEKGMNLAKSFMDLYAGQFALCPVRTTCTSDNVPSWLVPFLRTHNNAKIIDLECSPESFLETTEEGELVFEFDQGQLFGFDFGSVKQTGQFSLAVICAPMKEADQWARRSSSSTSTTSSPSKKSPSKRPPTNNNNNNNQQQQQVVKVVPGSHAHRIWGERCLALSQLMQSCPIGASQLIKLNCLFPVFISDNVRRLNQIEPDLNQLVLECVRTSSSVSGGGDTVPASSSSVVVPAGSRAFIGDVVVGLLFREDEPYVLRTVHGQTCEFVSGTICLAPVGQRESSTHVNSYIPKEGLDISFNNSLAWIATDSGLVGGKPPNTTKSIHPGAEKSIDFTVFGRLLLPSSSSSSSSQQQPRERLTLNTLDLALKPRSVVVRTPIIAIAGTSAEAGKTTLTSKLINLLSKGGTRRVGAIKATGTGGTEDSSKHRDAGAVFVSDQVDCGMPTTYISAEEFKKFIPTVFLAAEDANLDCLIVEFGGDVIFANNATLLTLDFFTSNLVSMFVIAGDALAAYGVAKWLSERYPIVAPKARLVNSPFRDFSGSKKRYAMLGLASPFNCNDVESIADVFTGQLVEKNSASSSSSSSSSSAVSAAIAASGVANVTNSNNNAKSRRSTSNPRQ